MFGLENRLMELIFQFISKKVPNGRYRIPNVTFFLFFLKISNIYLVVINIFVYLCFQTIKNLEIMTNLNNIKEGQKITFEYNGNIYTKKVIDVFTKGYGSGITMAYNVRSLGSGTQCFCVEQQDVISAK
jgi:hypothetical protein